jgi:hypothetical protein
MAPFEYLLVFAAVILGLAVCELAIGLNRLLAFGGAVKWDWLTPLAALLAFLKIVTQWWNWHGAVALAGGMTFEMYLLVLVGAAVLFMLAAAAFPATAGDQEVDLAAHYEIVRRRYWVLFTLHFLLAAWVSLWLQVAVGGARLSLASPVFLIAPVGLSLVFIRNRWWHTAALLGLIATYIASFYGRTLL